MRKWGIVLIALVVAIALWAVNRPKSARSNLEGASSQTRPQSTEPIAQNDPRQRVPSELDAEPDTIEEDSESSQLAEWPIPPESMEAIFTRAVYGLRGLENVTIESVQCSLTECEMRVLASNSDRNYYQAYSAIAQDITLPRGFNIDIDVELSEAAGVEFDVLRMSVAPPRDPTRFEIPGEQLREMAEGRAADENFSPAVRLLSGPLQVFVETVCSFDCPRDTKRIIFIEVPEYQTCDEVLGIEQTMFVATELGGLVERTLCVPNTLIEP